MAALSKVPTFVSHALHTRRTIRCYFSRRRRFGPSPSSAGAARGRASSDLLQWRALSSFEKSPSICLTAELSCQRSFQLSVMLGVASALCRVTMANPPASAFALTPHYAFTTPAPSHLALPQICLRYKVDSSNAPSNGSMTPAIEAPQCMQTNWQLSNPLLSKWGMRALRNKSRASQFGHSTSFRGRARLFVAGIKPIRPSARNPDTSRSARLSRALKR